MSPRGWSGNNCFAADGSRVAQMELGAVNHAELHFQCAELIKRTSETDNHQVTQGRSRTNLLSRIGVLERLYHKLTAENRTRISTARRKFTTAGKVSTQSKSAR